MNYAVLLGREPLLSLVELEAVLANNNQQSEVIVKTQDIVLFDGAENPEKIFNRLGGAIKIGKVVGVFGCDEFLEDPLRVLMSDVVLDATIGTNTSVAFALNVHGDAPSGFDRKIKSLGIAWKKNLRQRLEHVRYVESRDKTTSSVTVQRNKLLRGCDLWILFSGNEVMLIKTVAVQDYRSFGERDFGRPARNARSGMLPPKLARMMVNLACATDESVLLDPFVGSGTVLQEAALLGVKKLYGRDIEDRAVSETTKNMQWIIDMKHLSVEMNLAQEGIEELDTDALSEVTTIATELDLGTPLRFIIDKRNAQRYAKDASVLVEHLMQAVGKLPHLTHLVCALPFWPAEDTLILTPFTPPKHFELVYDFSGHEELFAEEYSRRGGLLYRREQQFVGREVLVLAKK